MKLENRIELELCLARRDYYLKIGDWLNVAASEKLVERALEAFVLDKYPWGSGSKLAPPTGEGKS